MFLECTLASDTMGAPAHRTHGTRGEDSGKAKLCLDQIPSTPFPCTVEPGLGSNSLFKHQFLLYEMGVIFSQFGQIGGWHSPN